MIRINGFPLFRLAWGLGRIGDALLRVAPSQEILARLGELRPELTFASGQTAAPNGEVSQLPPNTRALIANFLTRANAIVAANDIASAERGELVGILFQIDTILAVELAAFDLYLIEPKLGYETAVLLKDGTKIFPHSIQEAFSERIKYEIQQAVNCLLYEAPSAVGFHVLRAVEIVVLDYFTIPGWSRNGASTWTEYVREFKKYHVHPKIRAILSRLAELHRNELMHAEAVLCLEEAAILFAMMQEVLPIMIADVAKRKGIPIANFPILDDPRWQ
jgi:hypothetical protein